ncbi:MAG: hypothetical protein IT429_16370, partial [Gemmataceae bacterium]|nr:hypothetical protein [Gemmataceae bacterium]
MLKSANVHFTRSIAGRVLALIVLVCLSLGLAAFLFPAHGAAASPEVYVSSPTLPLIEWTAEDTMFRPRFPAGIELEEDLRRERGLREEDPEEEAAERRAEQASGLLSTIESITMLEDAALNGYYFIPADPSGAVGPNHVISVVNSAIRWHTTAGVAQNSQRLGMNSSGSIVGSFFESLNPINSLFDPKAYYDTQAGLFLVVVLEKGNSPTTSRILLAVSDDSDPNGTWYYLAINSKVNIGGNDCWADYPSLGVDEQAVYITNNMFTWPGGWGGNRLWIVDKTAFYAGSGGSATIYDPWALAGASGFATTCMVASIFGTAPSGNTGTWLLSYSGLTDGTNEYVGFTRVDNPIASPTFTYTQVNCGNIDNTSVSMPKSSQPGTGVQLEMNDSRALAACYRNNKLYLCAQVVPPSGTDAGQATVHWWKFDSTTPAAITLVDHGNVGGEEIASGTNTAFPSIAVSAADDIAVGFSASGASVYPGSYYAVRSVGDPAGTMQAPVVVAPGVDFYYRAFGGSRNRWGDYTVTAIDPTGTTFWTYNKYALSRGSILGGYPTEDGRWGTRWASFTASSTPAPLAASLTAPNGGESWGFGTAHNITWTATGGTAPITVDLDYSTNSGG